jgi:hypothetical protein
MVNLAGGNSLLAAAVSTTIQAVALVFGGSMLNLPGGGVSEMLATVVNSKIIGQLDLAPDFKLAAAERALARMRRV